MAYRLLVSLTLVEQGRRHFVALNVERAHELVSVLRHGIFLILRSDDPR